MDDAEFELLSDREVRDDFPELANREAGAKIRGVRQPCGLQGWVQLVDWMGDDRRIADAARCSSGRGVKTPSDDESLIRHLMRARHTSPFEQCEVVLRWFVPMDTWRQVIRTRTASVNEYSTRYSEAIDVKARTPMGDWRRQSASNRQGSGGSIPAGVGKELSEEERWLHEESDRVYRNRLDKGVAREQARKDLPLSTFTLAYWKIDLKNLLDTLALRMDKHAQKEYRDYATQIGWSIVAPLFPITWQAWLDCRYNAVTYTDRDLFVIRHASILMRESAIISVEEAVEQAMAKGLVGDRYSRGERDEVRAKATAELLIIHGRE